MAEKSGVEVGIDVQLAQAGARCTELTPGEKFAQMLACMVGTDDLRDLVEAQELANARLDEMFWARGEW